MPENHECLNLFLPNHWSRHVKSALLHVSAMPHVISLARLACVHTWAWATASEDMQSIEAAATRVVIRVLAPPHHLYTRAA